MEHAVGELIFAVNMLSTSVTPEEVERAKRELKLAKLASCDSSKGSAQQATHSSAGESPGHA